MHHTKRLSTLLLTLILLLTMLSSITAFAAPTTAVNIRIVLRNPMKYAACTAYLERYDSMSSQEAIAEQQIPVQRIDNWEKEVQLEPGFYQVVYVGVVGGWEIEILGTSERFEVKGDKMTVYVGVDNDEKPVTMPPNWLVYGEDDQNFGVWADDYPPNMDPSTPTEPSDPTTPTPPVEDLPNPDTGVEKDPNAPNHGSKPTIPDQDIPKAENPKESPSVQVGNAIFYGLIAIILIVCIFLLRKVQKERGA